VAEGGPAHEAGILPGDVLFAFGDDGVESFRDLVRAVGRHEPGELVPLGILRGGEEIERTVRLGDAADVLGMARWTRPEFRLAAILVEFPDRPHNARIPASEYERMLFSRGAYVGTNACGERVYGSLADYYAENSYGRLRVTGRVFDWVRVDVDRARLERAPMGSPLFHRDFLGVAIKRIRERDGKDALDGFDGVVVIYAGEQSHYRPRALWPHRATLRLGERRVPYYLAAEGGEWIGAIGVHVHEFGHMLGLPDQYGRRHATGVGKWCVMALGHMGAGASRNHRPFHLCAWCKMRLGWVEPADVDPRDVQAVRLPPVEDDPRAVVRVLARTDGSEYFLLENRQRIGFDSDLEGTGLLIWRVAARGRGAGVDLVEGHGLPVENASLVEVEEIPFPNVYNEHFTPETVPSSRVDDGLEVYITGIQRRGREILLRIGDPVQARTWTPPPAGAFR
jgi:M6 family metalloprotease-like protein